MTVLDIEGIAREVMAAQDGAASIAPLTARHAGFTLTAAYEVAGLIHRRRADGGAQLAGRKIGFTNAAMWSALGVSSPVWGRVYQHTLTLDEGGDLCCPAGAFVEPRIEPEIVLHFHTAPPATQDLERILACVDWIAHGFEVVQSHYPAWRFQAADTVADNALHAALFVGPGKTPAELGPDVIDQLAACRVTLSCDGARRETGTGANALGGPLQAMAHLLMTLVDRPADEAVKAGELVTTGTLTMAYPVHAGQVWNTVIDGLALPGMRLAFTDKPAGKATDATDD